MYTEPGAGDNGEQERHPRTFAAPRARGRAGYNRHRPSRPPFARRGSSSRS